jgi:hypothetical protein
MSVYLNCGVMKDGNYRDVYVSDSPEGWAATFI